MFQSSVADRVVKAGVDKSKLVIGLHTQAIALKLQTSNNDLYAPTDTSDGSRLTYPEVRSQPIVANLINTLCKKITALESYYWQF